MMVPEIMLVQSSIVDRVCALLEKGDFTVSNPDRSTDVYHLKVNNQLTITCGFYYTGPVRIFATRAGDRIVDCETEISETAFIDRLNKARTKGQKANQSKLALTKAQTLLKFIEGV